MTRTDEQVTALEAVAMEDSASVLELTRDLVRIPSRGGHQSQHIRLSGKQRRFLPDWLQQSEI